MCVLPFVTETEYLTVIAGVLAALIILLVSGLVFMYTRRKKQSNETKGTIQHSLQPSDATALRVFNSAYVFTFFISRPSLNRSLPP